MSQQGIHKPDRDNLVVPSGATVEVQSGGKLDLKSGATLLTNGAQGAAVADAAAIVAVTYTLNAPAAADGALTVADGSTPTVAELLEYCEELKANATSQRTAVNALIARLEAAGIIAS